MNTQTVNRFEYKYYLTLFDYIVLKNKLRAVMQADSHSNQDGRYIITSLYFDTHDNEAYIEKIEGYHSRKKIRIRFYNHSDNVIKLEMKQKEGDVVKKMSAHISKSDALELSSGNIDQAFIERLPNELKYHLNQNALSPKVIVEYDREAFTLDVNETRITFDMNVRKQEHLFDLFNSNLPLNGADTESIIMEVKFNNCLPTSLRHILQFDTSNRLAISKYCLSRSLIY
jgi:hypothetical protein